LKYSGCHFVVVGGGVVGVVVIMILLVVGVTLLFFLSSLRGLSTDSCQAMTGRNIADGRDCRGEVGSVSKIV
jgi:uncharacterized membrane protein